VAALRSGNSATRAATSTPQQGRTCSRPSFGTLPYRIYVPRAAAIGRRHRSLHLQGDRRYTTRSIPARRPAWNLKTLYATNDRGNSLTPISRIPPGPRARTSPRRSYNMYFTPTGASRSSLRRRVRSSHSAIRAPSSSTRHCTSTARALTTRTSPRTARTRSSRASSRASSQGDLATKSVVGYLTSPVLAPGREARPAGGSSTSPTTTSVASGRSALEPSSRSASSRPDKMHTDLPEPKREDSTSPTAVPARSPSSTLRHARSSRPGASLEAGVRTWATFSPTEMCSGSLAL